MLYLRKQPEQVRDDYACFLYKGTQGDAQCYLPERSRMFRYSPSGMLTKDYVIGRITITGSYAQHGAEPKPAIANLSIEDIAPHYKDGDDEKPITDKTESDGKTKEVNVGQRPEKLFEKLTKKAKDDDTDIEKAKEIDFRKLFKTNAEKYQDLTDSFVESSLTDNVYQLDKSVEESGKEGWNKYKTNHKELEDKADADTLDSVVSDGAKESIRKKLKNLEELTSDEKNKVAAETLALYQKERERDSEAADKVKFSALSSDKKGRVHQQIMFEEYLKEDMKDDAVGKKEQEK